MEEEGEGDEGDGEGMMTDDEELRVCANKRTGETHVERGGSKVP